MLAWNLRIQMRLGLSGFCMLVTKVLRLEEGLQTKDHLMARLHHADLYVQMRGIAGKIKEIICQSALALKLELNVKST